MVEITASDIFWIGQVSKISIGLGLLGLTCFYLSVMALYLESVRFFVAFVLILIFSLIAWVFVPSSETLAAMKVLNNQRIQGISESTVKLTEQFLKDKLETLKSKDKSGDKK